MKKIYIAGKITNNNFAKYEFEFAVDRFKSMGYEVYNPYEIGKYLLELGFSETEIMFFLLKILSKCDCAYFLPNYKDSYGAMIEYFWCLKNNIEIILD